MCSGYRALPDPVQCLHWGRRDCPPNHSKLSNALHTIPHLSMLSLQQVPFPWAVWGSLCCHCLPVTVTLLKTWLQSDFSPALSVTRASCAFRSSKAGFKNWLFRSKNQYICQYMPQPEQVTAAREQRMPGKWASVEEFHINSDPCQGVAVTLNSLLITATENLPHSHLLAGLWNTGMALELGHWQLSRY